MHRRLLALAAASLACLAATTAPAHAATFKACSGSFQPNGTPGGGFYGAIKEKGVGCKEARKVTQAWARKMASGEKPPTAKVTVLGYSCKGSGSSGTLAVLCSRAGGAKAVRFRGQP